MFNKISETVYTIEGYTIHKKPDDYILEQNKGDLERNQIPSLEKQIEIAEYFGYFIGNGNVNPIIQSFNNLPEITITHNRNRKVICQVYNQDDEEILCRKRQIDNNNIYLQFNPNLTGYAIIL